MHCLNAVVEDEGQGIVLPLRVVCAGVVWTTLGRGAAINVILVHFVRARRENYMMAMSRARYCHVAIQRLSSGDTAM